MVNHANRGRITGVARAFAATRETSDEIAQAIFNHTSSDLDARRIWEDPTEAEELSVMAEAWRLADDDVDALFWGGKRTRRL